MRNMLKGRPDWCVSRQRVWGVLDSRFFTARSCTEAVADPAVINHVADIFEKESGDAWYTREANELVARRVTRAKNAARSEWTKETDILDVWFDSGSSSIAVLENREELALARRCLHRRRRSISRLVQFVVDGRPCGSRSRAVQNGDHPWLDARCAGQSDAQVGGQCGRAGRSNQAIGRGDHSSVVCVVKLFRRHARVG